MRPAGSPARSSGWAAAQSRAEATATPHGLRSGIALEPDPIEDADLESAFTFPRPDLARFFDRRVLHVVGGLIVAGMVLLWPARTDRILVRLIGVALVLAFASTVWGAIRTRPTDRGRIVIGVAGVAIGAAFAVAPDQSIVTVGRLLAAVLAITSCRELVAQLGRPAEQREWPWPLAKAVAGLSAASLLAAYPDGLLAVVTIVLAAGWALLGAIALAQSLTGDERMWQYEDTGELIVEWLNRRPKEADDREALYGKILFEGPRLRLRIVRFFALMSFASVIAAMGVITDSTAVVIGAMLIAPLMTPLMGTAISVVMGWPNRLTRNAAIAAAGVGVSIAIGILLGLLVPTVIDVASNSQIIARSEPTILDLITAVAAGAAGAYGLSRPDVSDALPGVAIAISLVPPLSVVGIAYSQGAWDDGNGALLLFVTNALAIIIVGGITFVLTGVTPIRRITANQQRVRTATATIAGLATIVIGALTINGAEIATNTFEAASVDQALASWADEREGYSYVRSDIDGDDVEIVLLGPAGDPPPAQVLHAIVQSELGRAVSVRVRLVAEDFAVFPEP